MKTDTRATAGSLELVATALRKVEENGDEWPIQLRQVILIPLPKPGPEAITLTTKVLSEGGQPERGIQHHLHYHMSEYVGLSENKRLPRNGSFGYVAYLDDWSLGANDWGHAHALFGLTVLPFET